MQTINKSQFCKLSLVMFFLFLLLPNNVLANNCCEKIVTTFGGGASGSVGSNSVNSCIDGASITKNDCVSSSGSFTKVTAKFVENATCNDEKTACVIAPSTVATTTDEVKIEPLSFSFNVPLPGFPSTLEINSSVLPDYITWLFKFTIGVAGLLAVFMITVGGLMWIFAGGNGSKLGKAKEYITGAVIGLLLAVFSYSILYIINPQLILNKFPNLVKVDKSEIVPYTAPHNVIGSQSEECYYNEFGRTAADVQKELVEIPCPAIYPGKLSVHKKAADAFKQACSKIPEGTKTVCGTPLTSEGGGTFVWRMINGQDGKPTKYRSNHSWGIALDISPWQCYSNKPKNYPPLSGIQDNSPAARGKPHIPPSVINAFKSTPGFRWGGDYTNKGDNMHFEWLGSCATGLSNIAGSATKGRVDESKWVTKTTNYNFFRSPKYATQISTLVIFYHGWQIGSLTPVNVCNNYAWPEVAEISNEKILLACAIGDPQKIEDDPWNGSRASVAYNDAVANYKAMIKRDPQKIIIAGHSNAWNAMNKLMSENKTTDKYIWLDADYAPPRSCDKVTGIKTTNTDKPGDSSLCNGKIQKNITNDHFGAINYLSNFLKDLVN